VVNDNIDTSKSGGTVIGYAFWHIAEDESNYSLYEETLIRFGEALSESNIPGVLGCASYAIHETPWVDEPGHLAAPSHEDWVWLTDSSVLETLNDRAVSHDMAAPHGAIARITKHRGFGSLYYLVDGEHSMLSDSTVYWLARPRGVDWHEVMAAIVSSTCSKVCVWRRLMVLGPAPEFAIVGPPGLALDIPGDWNATAVNRRRLVR